MKAITTLIIIIVIAATAYFLYFKGDEPVASVPQQTSAVTTVTTVTTGTYQDPSGFSFELPLGYSARTIDADEGKTVLFERIGDTSRSFQVFITAYDEPAAGFNLARIRQDLPDLVMKNPKEFKISDGQGIYFDSDTGREIWFVAGEHLFQVTAPMTEAEPAEHIVAEFKLNK